MNVFKNNFTWQVRADRRLVKAFSEWAACTWKEAAVKRSEKSHGSSDKSSAVKIGGISVGLNDLIYAHLKRVGCAPDVDPIEWRVGMSTPFRAKARRGVLSKFYLTANKIKVFRSRRRA